MEQGCGTFDAVSATMRWWNFPICALFRIIPKRTHEMRLPVFNRSLAMLLLAGVAGLGAAWAAKQHIDGKVQLLEAQARTPMVERIVAAYDLPAGTRMGPEHLALRHFPANVASSGSLDRKSTRLNSSH